ncbi:MAG TPA: ABC transporter permease [Actinomycetota bacterium]|nr:ABC transporter permease [Actinomycetota bacterium]
MSKAAHSDAALVARQFRAEWASFWRNPAAAGFTFVFPIMFMVIFNLLFDDPYTGRGPRVSAATFFTPALITFSLVSACFTNIAIGVVFAREEGVLKRVRGTPLPPWIYLAGRIVNAVVVALILVAIMLAFGTLVYGVELPGSTMPAFVATLLIGAASLCALGLAATTLVPNEDAAPPIINLMVLPLLFVSDVFIPLEDAPGWLTTLADAFPIRPLATSLIDSFIGGGSGWHPRSLAVVTLWGLAGVAVAARRFRWEPKR